MIYPPLYSHFELPDVSVTTDRGDIASLRSLMTSTRDAVILLPGFSTCHGTCPALVHLYKRILTEARVDDPSLQKISVVFLSFDPEESQISLAHFRERSGISHDWTMVFANPADTQKLLASLQYTVMKTEDGFQHPAQAFVFTKDAAWIGSLYGTNVTKSELTQIASTARFHQNYPRVAAVMDTLQSPNTAGIIGCAGFVCALVAVLWLGVRMRNRT